MLKVVGFACLSAIFLSQSACDFPNRGIVGTRDDPLFDVAFEELAEIKPEYLTLAALVARSQEHITVRLYLLGIAILLTMLVGTTRVYLGVHWPSDVIAGWCIGAIWAVLCSLIAKSLQRRQKIESGADQLNIS